MPIQLKTALKLIIGFPLYIITNNIIINLVSIIGFQYYHFYLYGANCTGGFSTKGFVITTVFILFKLIVMGLYTYSKKCSFLFYYLIFDVLMGVALLFDTLFNTFSIAFFYSNRPLLNLSHYLFGNYTLIFILSTITLALVIKREKLFAK